MKKIGYAMIGAIVGTTLIGCIGSNTISEQVINDVSESVAEELSKTPQKCTYSEENGSISGIVYIDGENSYTEGKIVDNEFRMIIKDGITYMWEKDSSEGTMYTTQDDDEDYSEFEDEEFVAESPEDYENYQCEPWIPNSAMFDTPENINFIDLSTMVNEFSNGFESICDELQGQDKTDCMNQFN